MYSSQLMIQFDAALQMARGESNSTALRDRSLMITMDQSITHDHHDSRDPVGVDNRYASMKSCIVTIVTVTKRAPTHASLHLHGWRRPRQLGQ